MRERNPLTRFGGFFIGQTMVDAIRIDGLSDIMQKIALLPDKPVRNALTRALRKGANVIRDDARVRARALDDPETPAMIYKNIVSASMKRSIAQRRGADAGMRVGVMGGARLMKDAARSGLPGGNTTHWRMLEYGTSTMAAQPFMRPAMERNVAAAFEAIGAAMDTEFDKELAKLT